MCQSLSAWSFSACTVLLYYSLTNLAALRLPAGGIFQGRVIPLAGLASSRLRAITYFTARRLMSLPSTATRIFIGWNPACRWPGL